MNIVIIAILFAGAALFVGYPLFKREETRYDTQSLQVNEPAVLSMIEELELDFEMGNISEEEYLRLDAQYRAELN